MTRTPTNRLLLPMLLCLPTTLVAQPPQERFITGVLLLRCGPSDVVLNEELLDALLAEPAARHQFAELFGDAFSGGRLAASMPAQHAPGTYQIHIRGNLRVGGEWQPTDNDRALDAAVEHLLKRLDALLYSEPKARLQQQAEQLVVRHLELQGRLNDLRQRHAERRDARQGAQQQHAALEHELVAAQIELMTEKKANQHLIELRNSHQAERDKLRRQLRDVQLHRVETATKVRLLEQRIAGAGEAKPKDPELLRTLDGMAAELAALDDEIRRLQDADDDHEALLTVVLEQLPTSELQLRRAMARLAGLEESGRKLDDRAKELARTAAADRDLQIELLEIDVTVTRQQLLEVKSQLARLAPPHHELLRMR